jgi:hypothetical protein
MAAITSPPTDHDQTLISASSLNFPDAMSAATAFAMGKFPAALSTLFPSDDASQSVGPSSFRPLLALKLFHRRQFPAFRNYLRHFPPQASVLNKMGLNLDKNLTFSDVFQHSSFPPILKSSFRSILF